MGEDIDPVELLEPCANKQILRRKEGGESAYLLRRIGTTSILIMTAIRGLCWGRSMLIVLIVSTVALLLLRRRLIVATTVILLSRHVD
jgi:hypothetical protein